MATEITINNLTMLSPDYNQPLPLCTKPIRVSELTFDLQMFAGEKTEEATDKRKRDAVKEGNVAKSQDLASVIILLAGFMMLNAFGSYMFSRCADFMRFTYTQTIKMNFAFEDTVILFHQFVLLTTIILLPILGIVFLAGIVSNIAQVGLLFRFDPMQPNFDRMNPISGLQNIFTMKMFAELAKSIFKIGIVAYIPYATIRDNFGMFIKYVSLDAVPSFGNLLEICYSMAIKIILIFIVIALADLWFQRWRYNESLKMSKQDVQEEHKQQEGDPHVKQKIRERQRQASQRRQMEDVPKATVVITNPTHIAVALKYEPGQHGAPVVVAMGAGFIAQKIKEIAAENNIPIVENKPLARQMYKSLEVGEEIPSELYNAVVEILAQVFRNRQKKAA